MGEPHWLLTWSEYQAGNIHQCFILLSGLSVVYPEPLLFSFCQSDRQEIACLLIYISLITSWADYFSYTYRLFLFILQEGALH